MTSAWLHTLIGNHEKGYMNFDQAFNLVMKSEVGPHWDPTDLDVIAGNHTTAKQRKKIGYVNIAGDRGGLTSYGIAQKPNPSVDVDSLDLAKVKAFYKRNYWGKCKCDLLPSCLEFAVFDAAVNHGVSRSIKLLQEIIGAKVDGNIGDQTLQLAHMAAPMLTPKDILAPRRAFYAALIERDPSQAKFAKGWEARCAHVQEVIK